MSNWQNLWKYKRKVQKPANNGGDWVAVPVYNTICGKLDMRFDLYIIEIVFPSIFHSILTDGFQFQTMDYAQVL